MVFGRPTTLPKHGHETAEDTILSLVWGEHRTRRELIALTGWNGVAVSNTLARLLRKRLVRREGYGFFGRWIHDEGDKRGKCA